MPRWMLGLLVLVAIWFMYANPSGAADIVLKLFDALWAVVSGIGKFFGKLAEGLG